MMNRPAGHPEIPARRIGVLLINLGTPEATSYWPMRGYLKEFLSDPRVIETNRVLWWFILNAVILTTRPGKSGHAYEKIWNRARDESPLKTITRAQSEALAEHFSHNPAIIVDWAMRYGKPPIEEALHRLHGQGCDRILLFPLYPQYAAATTATALDKAYDGLRHMRWQPAIRTVPPYYDDAAYIDALAASLTVFKAKLDWHPDVILASFHGLPKEYLLKGDPYHCQCQKTARLLRESLSLNEQELLITFQSRFGKAEWLKPYTDETVEQMARDGVKNLLVITPGFAADCVETLEEIDIGVRETFVNAGGVNFATVPCLNDSKWSIDLLSTIVQQQLSGW